MSYRTIPLKANCNNPAERRFYIEEQQFSVEFMRKYIDKVENSDVLDLLQMDIDYRERSIRLNQQAEKEYQNWVEWANRMKSYYEQNGSWRHN